MKKRGRTIARTKPEFLNAGGKKVYTTEDNKIHIEQKKSSWKHYKARTTNCHIKRKVNAHMKEYN